MLDLDVAARAIVTENGIELSGVPEGIRFELLSPDYDATLIPDDDKFAREPHKWEHGLLVHVPKGVESRSRSTCRSRRTAARSSGGWS